MVQHKYNTIQIQYKKNSKLELEFQLKKSNDIFKREFQSACTMVLYMCRSFYGVGRLHPFPGYLKNKSLHFDSEEKERQMLF